MESKQDEKEIFMIINTKRFDAHHLCINTHLNEYLKLFGCLFMDGQKGTY